MRAFPLLAAILLASSARAQEGSPAAHYSPVILTVGGSFGDRGISDASESSFSLARHLVAGYRPFDILSIVVEQRKLVVVTDETYEIRMGTVEFYPYYRQGYPGYRASLSVGRANLHTNQFGGGHQSHSVDGKANVFAFTFARDMHVDVFSVGLFGTVSHIMKAGLTSTSCTSFSTSTGYSPFDCGTSPAASGITMAHFGLSFGLR